MGDRSGGRKSARETGGGTRYESFLLSRANWSPPDRGLFVESHLVRAFLLFWAPSVGANNLPKVSLGSLGCEFIGYH